MTTYLQTNGTSDYISVPSFTYDSVEINFSANFASSAFQYYYSDSSSGFVDRRSDGTDAWGSVSSVTYNGTSVTSFKTDVPSNTIGTLKFSLSTPGSYSSYIFSNKGTQYFLSGNIYYIKYYSGGATVAYYDMSTGTVNDQSGNGHNATLHGGTWVSSGTPTGTPESVTFDTKLRIHAQETVNFDSKQKIYTTESVSFDTKQSITAGHTTETVNFDTKQVIHTTESVSFDTKQCLHVVESSSFDTKQRVYTTESVSFDTEQTIKLASSFESVTFDTKQLIYASESTKFPTRQQIREQFRYVTTIGR